MKRDYTLYLKDILESCRLIQEFVNGFDYDQFISDEKTVSAVVQKLEVIGEASKNIPDEIKQKAPDITWKEMAGMRDRLIHAYFGIDYKLVWETIKVFINELSNTIEELLTDLS